MNIALTAFAALTLVVAVTEAQGPYEPTWESIETRPIPGWFPKQKFGIFIHWGVYAVPAYSCDDYAAEWYEFFMDQPCISDFHNRVFGEDFPYRGFGPLFEAEMYDPDHWAETFKRSGANYIVITSKHHDGYCLWDTPLAPLWNSVDMGPHRNLMDELWDSMRRIAPDMHLGLYHSLLEWGHELYLEDYHNNNGSRRFPLEHMLPMMRELVQKFEPDIWWSDGHWERPYTYWGSLDFLSWLYNESPVKDRVVVNDRWDPSADYCTQSCSKTIEDTDGDFDPNYIWEECRTMSTPSSWGFNRRLTAENYETSWDLIRMLIRTVAYNGNLLLNVGPTSDGRIDPTMEQRLIDIGAWLEVNSEAIFDTKFYEHPNEREIDVFYTESVEEPSTLYAIPTFWPEETLSLEFVSPTPDTEVTLLGSDVEITWEGDSNGNFVINVPILHVSKLPSLHAYVFKITKTLMKSKHTISIN